ncbi:hypothetical protein Ancab_021256 [Ancistrocladus abbreviatus]
MKLQYLPRNATSVATKSESHLCKLSYCSRGISELKFHNEEFVSTLLNRRWTLQNPDTKIHQIMLLKKQGLPKSGYFADIKFSINSYPKLGDAMKEQNNKDVSFYVVRDDLLHPLVNGNKARKLDALLPIIEDFSGTDVVTCGGCQSAHAAAVAVSSAERGITSHLLLRGEAPEILTGYNLVCTMYGKVTYVPRGLYAKREEMLLRHAHMVAGANGSVAWFSDISDSFSLSFGGLDHVPTDSDVSSENCPRKVIVVNEGARDVVALLGVIRLVRYLSQGYVLGERPYNFVVDAGTGTTAVGLALGALCLGLPWKVNAVMLAEKQEKRLISDFRRCSASTLIDYAFNGPSSELVNWVDRINPRKFGNVLDGEVEACQEVARQTGILVDPIYTLAAWELSALLSQQEAEDGAKVVMLHTGGTLGMFGLAQRYKPYFSLLKDGLPR